MYKNKISECLEDIKAVSDAFGRSTEIYASTGSKPAPELKMKDLFKGVYEALKISGEASIVVWKEMMN
jgi:hypothetical protein